MADGFYYRSGPVIVRRYPIASGTVIEVGDLVKDSSGKLALMATSTDNLSFVGVAAEAHAAGDASGSIGVYLPIPGAIFEYDLNAATDVVIGDELQYNAAKKLKVSSTDPIAVAIESKLTAANVLVTFKLTQSANGLDFAGDLT